MIVKRLSAKHAHIDAIRRGAFITYHGAMFILQTQVATRESEFNSRPVMERAPPGRFKRKTGAHMSRKRRAACVNIAESLLLEIECELLDMSENLYMKFNSFYAIFCN